MLKMVPKSFLAVEPFQLCRSELVTRVWYRAQADQQVVGNSHEQLKKLLLSTKTPCSNSQMGTGDWEVQTTYPEPGYHVGWEMLVSLTPSNDNANTRPWSCGKPIKRKDDFRKLQLRG